MTEIQRLIETCHSEFGLSDRLIAAFCKVSREHINRVHHGREQGSADLARKLQESIAYLRENDLHAIRKHYDRRAKHPTPPPVSSPRAARIITQEPARMSAPGPQFSTPPVPSWPAHRHRAVSAFNTSKQCYVCAASPVSLYNVPGRGRYNLCFSCAQRYNATPRGRPAQPAERTPQQPGGPTWQNTAPTFPTSFTGVEDSY